jgi:acetolactate synthase I/II/III large subunit
MKVVEAIARGVVAEGVELVFNVPDEVTVFLADALQEEEVRIFRPRHEQSAISIADAYARATNRPAVCSVGAGPAVAQTGNGFMTAARRGSPVLVFVPDVRRPGDVKRFDLQRYAESVGARYVNIRSAATVAQDVREGFRQVRLRQGPVVVGLPEFGVLESELPEDWAYRPSIAGSGGIPRCAGLMPAAPESDFTNAAARALLSAARPIIIAGRGAVLADACGEIKALADSTGALLATSLQARQYFRGHHRDIGVIGGFAAPGALALLAQADCILAVGATLNPYQMGHVALAANVQIVHIDHDPSRIGQFTPTNLAIINDARLAVRALNDSVASNAASPSSLWRTDEVRERLELAQVPEAPAVSAAPDKLPITKALPEIEELLPKDRMIVIDGGLFIYFAVDGISVPDPTSFVWTLDFGSIGLGLPMGIGTALARPDRPCVVIVGDGGLAMSIQELETAVRERVPLTIVVLNDAAYGAEVRFLEANGRRGDVAVFDDIDFAAIARAVGARGLTVRAVDDFAAVRDALAVRDGPLVIDMKLTEDEDHRYLGFLEVMTGAERVLSASA